MDTRNRELIRAEIKSVAFHRRNVKERSRSYARNASKLFEEAYTSENGAYWKDERWLQAHQSQSVSVALRWDASEKARALNIAYGLLRGIPYQEIESSCHEEPNPEVVLHYCKVYSSRPKDWTLDKVKELLKRNSE